MSRRSAKLLLAACGLATGLVMTLAPAADAAQAGKKKRQVTAPAASVQSRQRTRTSHWGQGLVRSGPLYNGPDYLGDDPDPNIRAYILKDLTGRYGGED
jgi:hypothetical protein